MPWLSVQSMMRVAVVVLGLTVPTIARGECIAPKYRQFLNTIGSKGGSINVSIQQRDLALERLLCLSSALRKRHPDWKNVNVFVFTSNAAAKWYVPDGLSENGDFRRDLRALYSVDDEKESLRIMPIGTSSQYFNVTPSGIAFADLYDTQIDLPPAIRPRCRLSIGDRCILSLQQFEYPQAAHQRRVSGTVTVAAVADRHGKVTAKVVNQADDLSLTQAALENVSTWWIEAAPREDSFQITFAYELDSTLAPGQIDLQIELPTRVTIRANPVASR